MGPRRDATGGEMTAKRDLKKRVRERQARTGESYTTARSRVLADRPAQSVEPAPARTPPIVVEEMLDVTADAQQLGIKCRVTTTSAFARQIDPVRVLERVRDALVATEGDTTLADLRAVVLHGEKPIIPKLTTHEWIEDTRRFYKRVKAGIAGTNDVGNMLALHVEGRAGPVLVICYIWMPIFRPAVGSPRAPSLVLMLEPDTQILPAPPALVGIR
jgi:hypothetical protein